MGGVKAGPRSRRRRRIVVLAPVAAALLVSCTSAGTTKSGAALSSTDGGPVTLRFAAGEPQGYDGEFAKRVSSLSGGRVTVKTVSYDTRSTTVDVDIARDLAAGKLDLADVASRAWVQLGVDTLSAYQVPFLVTSRALLDRVTGGTGNTSAAAAMAGLTNAGATGLAVVPRGVRYLFSTRPLASAADLRAAVVRINDDPIAHDVLTALGAKTDSTTRSGPDTLAALRSGALTAVEADVQSARVNAYPSAAPYVMGAALYAKTTTFVASSARLKALGSTVAGWVTRAATEAAGAASTQLDDRAAWAGACAAGARPTAVAHAQLDALHVALDPVYQQVSAKPGPTLAESRIALVATQAPRTDAWAACGRLPSASSTATVDDVYTATETQDEVRRFDTCLDCGNAGDYTLTIHDGRYALQEANVQLADPSEASVAFIQGWGPDDPVEVGSVLVSGARATFRPDVGQQFGALPVVYGFQVFRSTMRWTFVSGTDWSVFTAHPWQKVG